MSTNDDDALPGFRLRTLAASDLDDVHAFSASVFERETTPSEHPSRAQWQRRYAEMNGVVIGVYEAAQLVGYCFAHEIDRHYLPAVGDAGGLHVWLCATAPAFRGRGIASALLRRCADIARRRGLAALTVNTYPDYFPSMYRLLSSDASGFTPHVRTAKKCGFIQQLGRDR